MAEQWRLRTNQRDGPSRSWEPQRWFLHVHKGIYLQKRSDGAVMVLFIKRVSKRISFHSQGTRAASSASHVWTRWAWFHAGRRAPTLQLNFRVCLNTNSVRLLQDGTSNVASGHPTRITTVQLPVHEDVGRGPGWLHQPGRRPCQYHWSLWAGLHTRRYHLHTQVHFWFTNDSVFNI